VPSGQQSAFVRRVAVLGERVVAVTRLLAQIAGMLSQLAYVIGWLLLLIWMISLPFRQNWSSRDLVLPGAGAVGVSQGLVRLGGKRSGMLLISADTTETVDPGPSGAHRDSTPADGG